MNGAGNGTRTRDIKLGKLALYQLSYARPGTPNATENLADPPPIVKSAADGSAIQASYTAQEP